MTLLSDRVHHELKARLTLWEYFPGQALREEAIAAEFGVSRTPVRDALRRLELEGFLEQEGWAGYRVRKPDLPRMEELYEVRLSLEQTAVRRLASAPADPEDQLLVAWQLPKQERRAPDPEMVHADEAFHETLAPLAGNRTLHDMLCSINEHIRVIRTNDFLTPRRISETYRQHRGILLAIRRGNPVQEVQRLSDHIQESQSFVGEAATRALSRILTREPDLAESTPPGKGR